jgi:hypothetical protein
MRLEFRFAFSAVAVVLCVFPAGALDGKGARSSGEVGLIGHDRRWNRARHRRRIPGDGLTCKPSIGF